jgi:hypothetical protein
MTLGEIERACAAEHLANFGAFYPDPEDLAPEGTGTIVLLGPQEPGFWAMFSQSPEYLDTLPHPMDRWSERVITALASALGAQAFFPFGGPPFQPFIRWAHASGRAFASPVGLLVHNAAGMMVSYRGALGFAERLDLPPTSPNPCTTCTTQPCRTACPVDAFASGSYDVARCKTDLDRAGNDCMAQGCAVRRACPLSQNYGRQPEQSAFHMRAFR